MRTLVITRGLPGSGKSTFVRERGWAPYAIEPDALRLMHHGPEMQMDGGMSIPSQSDSAVWKQVYALLEERMAEGAFTVVDATHLYPQALTPYRKLAERYRYRVHMLDFTGIPEDELLRRNAGRGIHRVPTDVLRRMARRTRSLELPKWVDVLEPAEWGRLLWRPLELDHYRRVLHVGDVHGCYTALRALLPEDEPCADTFYIFHGDLVDRGTENAAVVAFMARWVEYPNVVVLEGNHEASLRAFAGMEVGAPAEYGLYTRRELEASGLAPGDVGRLYRRTWQCCQYTYHGRNVFACHGGVPGLADNPLYINTRQLVDGVGGYGRAGKVAQAWDAAMPPDSFQVHGHRNREGLPVQASGRVFNLEGQVEFGGCLRAVELTGQGFRTMEIPNPVPAAMEMQRFTPWLFPRNASPQRPVARQDAKPEPPPLPENPEHPEVAAFVRSLRADPAIREKVYDGISAFAPRRNHAAKGVALDGDPCAFFVDTASCELVARGYGCIPEQWSLPFKTELSYPVTAYVQENGFLGLAGYNHRTDSLVLATRRSLDGPYVRMFRDTLRRCIDLEELAACLKGSRTTLAFEVVGRMDDPHLVPYAREEVILLDEIHNTPDFRHTPYKRLCAWAERNGYGAGGLRVKKLAGVFHTRSALFDFLLSQNDAEIEGHIVEDVDGRMVCYKTSYYHHWAWCREELRLWTKKMPTREELEGIKTPFIRWAYDYVLSHPDETAMHGIDFHSLRWIYNQLAH